MASPFQNLNINWDFTLDAKKIYFNSPLIASGDLSVSFCDELSSFYEICTLCDSQVFIKEALENKAIFLDGVTKPFLYLKNIGNFNLFVCSADSESTGIYFDHAIEKINKKFNCSYSNYKLSPQEGIVLNINASQNGSYYFSSGEYPFGFYYTFNNIIENNSFGEFPICEISGSPIYRYDNLCNFNINYMDCSCNPLTVINNGTYRVYDAPSDCMDFVSVLFKDENNIQITGSEFDISAGCFNFSTWFKLNCINNTGVTSIAYIDSANPYSLLSFNNECIIIGTGDVKNVELCFSTDSICFNRQSPSFCGGIINNNEDEKYTLNTDNFTIDFFAKVNNFNLTSFFDFNGIKLHLQDYSNLTFELGCSSYNWQPNLYVKTGQWQHFAISRNEGCVRIYSDYCCVFGACNTGLLTGYCNAFIGYRDGYYTLDACMYGFRFLKNQSLYTGNSIQRVLPSLSLSGFAGKNQEITGVVEYLGLQSSQLDSGWNDRSVSYGNAFVYTELVCEVIESGFFIKSGLKENDWNYFSVNVQNCIGQIWLNGNLKCIFCGLDNSGINFANVTGEKIIIGNYCNDYSNFNGLLSYLQFTKNNNYFISSFPNISGFDDGGYPECLSLALDFSWICDPTESYRSFCFSSLIDNNLNLITSFSGINESVISSIDSASKFGNNLFNYFVTTKCIHYYCNGNFICFLYPEENKFNCEFFSNTVSGSLDICLLYDIDFSSKKQYYFEYEYSGTCGDSCQNLILVNSISPCCIIQFSGSCLIEPDNRYKVSGDALDKFYLQYNLNTNYSLSKLKNKEINNECLFLPVYENFPYNYCYQLANLNFSFETGISGSFVSTGFVFEENKFLNFSSIINCSNQDYIDNQPIDYYFCLNYDENRFSTTSFLCKDQNSISEDFIPIYASFQKSYFYSGIEYKYYPVCCVVYKDLIYKLPETCINLNLYVGQNFTSLDFPIQALNLNNLKIVSNSEIYERLNCSTACLFYENINFTLKCEASNSLCINIPKIKNILLNCFESPNLFLSSCFKNIIDDCVSLYLDPYSNFNLDKFYGLNNLLFFIANELNSGTIHQCNYSGTAYGSSEYSFLMIDLENEFYDCCYLIPSGTGSFLICQKTSSRISLISEPFSYKSKNGCGYSYILPIANCFLYSDCFNHQACGSFCSEINLNTNLNFLNTGFKYNGGYCDACKVYYEDNVFSGYETGFINSSMLNIYQNGFNISIDSGSINQTETGRFLNFCKLYAFSGVQPLKFISNYPLLEIKDPIYTRDLSKYSNCESETGINDFYYIVYDISNYQNKPIKFLSPECTFISCIEYVEKNSNQIILSNDLANNCGKIKYNAGYIKYDASNLIDSNPYFLCFCDKYSVYIEIEGGLL